MGDVEEVMARGDLHAQRAQSHKRIVHRHIAAALLMLATVYGMVWLFVPWAGVVEPSARLLVALQLQAFVLLPLLFGVGVTVHARYSDATLIAGYQAPEPEWFRLLQAYNRNTLEQTVLCAFSSLAFCAVVPAPWLKLVLAQVVAFLLGRALFFIGYRVHPLYRLVGFAIGYYPSIVSILAVISLSVERWMWPD